MTTTLHLLSVSYDSEPGWIIRARHERHRKKLGRLLRSSLPADAYSLHGTTWFVSDECVIELREILADVYRDDEIKFCPACERSDPCASVWNLKTLGDAGFSVGEKREKMPLFDSLEELLEWVEQHPLPPSVRPGAAQMSKADAARLLGVTLPATPEEIDAAFKQAALRHHPDRGGSTEMMAKVIQARDALRSV
jgi:hypothetical protein